MSITQSFLEATGNWHQHTGADAIRIDYSNITNAPSKIFGGDGSDGVLNITSGTTTINLASANVVIKNYTSISITGTGKLAFSNPHANGTLIVLKSQGDVTLTSSSAPMIDASSLGAAGGAALAAVAGNGNSGSLGNSTIIQTNFGLGGTQNAGGTPGTGAAASTALPFTSTAYGKLIRVACGAGGGSGALGSNNGNSGAGGRGGAGLIIECNGALNFITASGISVAGANGGPGADSTGPGAGAGGGGAGGTCAILYRVLNSNTGTITVSGGNGGNGSNGGSGTSGGCGAGSGGANGFAGGAGGAGGAAGASGAAGSAGSGTGGGTGGTGGSGAAGSGGGGGGGGGAAGISYVVQNNDFF